MKKKTRMQSLCLSLLSLCAWGACETPNKNYGEGNLTVSIEQGDEWLHDFPLFLGIKAKNAPQIAVWTEDTNGKYLSTLYVSKRIATQSWIGAGSNRRKEALPHWCYSRGVQYDDGLYLPTKNNPLPDVQTGATPKSSFIIRLHPENGHNRFVVKIEINHSTDFNDHFNESIQEGAPNYSGGKMGSGQPALVYAAEIDMLSSLKTVEAHLLGHSSPDGTSGAIDPNISLLTTALHIVKRITVTLP